MIFFPHCKQPIDSTIVQKPPYLKVKNEILTNMEDQCVTLLMLLDLSAAFDTVDHQILLHRLQPDFGISDSALNWFESFRSNRTQHIWSSIEYLQS